MCFKNNGLKAQPAAPPSLLVALLAEAPAATVALSVQHAPQPWKEYRRILLPTNREVHVWCLTCVSHSSERSQGWKIPYIESYRNSCLGSMNNGNALQDSTQWHQFTRQCHFHFPVFPMQHISHISNTQPRFAVHLLYRKSRCCLGRLCVFRLATAIWDSWSGFAILAILAILAIIHHTAYYWHLY